MADVNPNALALAVAQPNVDLTGPLKSVAEVNMASAHAALFGAQARYQIARQNALAQAAQLRAKGDPNWMNPIAMVDPEAAKHMQDFDWTQQEHQASQQYGDIINQTGDRAQAARAVAGYPNVADTISKAYSTMQQGQQTDLKVHMDLVGQASNTFLDAVGRYQRGDISKDDLRRVWNEQSTRIMQASKNMPGGGGMGPVEYNAMYDMPNLQMAINRARQGLVWSQASKDYWEGTGEPAARKAEGELPSKIKTEQTIGEEHRKTELAKPFAFPVGHAVTTGNLLQQGQGTEATNQGDMAPGTPVAPGNIGQVGADLPQMIVPHQNLGTQDPRMLVQGTDPQTQDRIKVAADHYEKDTKTPGMMAYGQRSSLNEMENLILSGKVTTNVASEMKEQMAGWVYAIMGGGSGDTKADARALDVAKRWTGIDLASQPIMNKFTTQMGLQYARATEGAREAVAAIKIALGANPQSTTPREANLRIIRLMKAANQYSIDKMDYGNQYFQQNKHYVGSDEAFSNQRTPEMYTSRVEPFHLPTNTHGYVDSNRLQPGVMYQFTRPGDKAGKVEYGVWNGKQFNAVEF